MRELLFLIALVLGVAIGFAGCGDDDEKTDAPVESSVDAGGEVAESDAAGEDASEAAGGAGGEAVEEPDTGTAGEDASEAAGGAEAE